MHSAGPGRSRSVSGRPVSRSWPSASDWNENQWLTPIDVQVSKLLTVGEQKVQVQFAGRYWAESPESGPEDLGASIKITFLFPK